jgi:hypothetical protein
MLENTQNIYVVDVPAAPIDAACHENIEMATNLGASYTGFFFHNKKNWYEMKAMQFARVECVKYLYEAALPVTQRISDEDRMHPTEYVNAGGSSRRS